MALLPLGQRGRLKAWCVRIQLHISPYRCRALQHLSTRLDVFAEGKYFIRLFFNPQIGLRRVTGGHSVKSWWRIAGTLKDKRYTAARQSRAYTDPKMTGIRQRVVVKETGDNAAISRIDGQ